MSTGCGETSEATAARAHGIVALISALTIPLLAATLVTEVVIFVWHLKSRDLHLVRGRAKGELP